MRASSIISTNVHNCQIDFRNVKYSVAAGKKKIKTIFHGVSGTFRAGRVTAIIGPTGTGKTCLLSALAGQLNQGQISGDLYLNEQPIDSSEMHKITGFVHQDSLVYETLTVREALDMSVKLRCDRSLSATEQKRRIADSLHVLHLSHVANTVIGNSLKRGISGGEKKRVCVGMELITEPVVLFLDEPTTGLDALAAYQLVETLHNLALLGRTVVLTIHQPSSEMLEFIDDIFFMAEGRVLYAGPTNKMMDYFSQYDISCPAYSNPIDYLFLNLFYVETDEIDEYDDYASDRPTNNLVVPLLQNNENATPIESIVLPRKITVERRLDTLFTGWSKKKAQLTADIQDEFRNSGLDWTHYRKQKASFFVQYKYLIRRGFYDRIRNPSIVGLRLVQVLGAAMLIDIVYWQITTREQSIQIMDRGRYIFFLCSTMITQFAYDTATTFCLARKLFMREYRDGYFGVPAFFLSMITVETPLYAIIGVIYGLATYFAVGMPGGTERILTFCGICALIALAGMMVGVVVSCMTNKYDIVSSIASIFTITMMMFGGLFSNLGAIPAWIRWLEWVSPVKYGFAALLQNSSKDYNISCGDNPPSECQPIPAFASVKLYKADDHGSITFNALMLLAFWAAVSCMGYLGYHLHARAQRSSYTHGFKKTTRSLK